MVMAEMIVPFSLLQTKLKCQCLRPTFRGLSILLEHPEITFNQKQYDAAKSIELRKGSTVGSYYGFKPVFTSNVAQQLGRYV